MAPNASVDACIFRRNVLHARGPLPRPPPFSGTGWQKHVSVAMRVGSPFDCDQTCLRAVVHVRLGILANVVKLTASAESSQSSFRHRRTTSFKHHFGHTHICVLALRKNVDTVNVVCAHVSGNSQFHVVALRTGHSGSRAKCTVKHTFLSIVMSRYTREHGWTSPW